MLSRRELICCVYGRNDINFNCQNGKRLCCGVCVCIVVCAARGVSGDLVARRVGHPAVVVIVPLELDPVVLRPLGVQWRVKGKLFFGGKHVSKPKEVSSKCFVCMSIRVGLNEK
jgi:hypothetical protein